MPPPSPQTSTSIEQKLDQILMHIAQMNRRDKWRTIGGFVRSLIAIIPVLIFLWATWYTVVNGDAILKKISAAAAEQAARVAQQNGGVLFNQINKYLPK